MATRKFLTIGKVTHYESKLGATQNLILQQITPGVHPNIPEHWIPFIEKITGITVSSEITVIQDSHIRCKLGLVEQVGVKADSVLNIVKTLLTPQNVKRRAVHPFARHTSLHTP